MKRKLFLILLTAFTLMLVACKPTETPVPPVEVVEYTVVFNSNSDSVVANQIIQKNGLVVEPSQDPSKEGNIFVYWYLDNAEIAYDFSLPVTQNITLTAKWELIPDKPVEKTNQEKIAEDIAAVQADFYGNRYYVNAPSRGPIHNSSIRWSSSSKYVSKSGIVLPVLPNEEGHTAVMEARITLNGTIVEHQFDIELTHIDPVVLTTEKTVTFENITTEYEVADSELLLLFEEDGYVPHVGVKDFFNLLTGFIDPKYELTFTTEGNVLTVAYQYIDEEEHQAFLDGESEEDGIYDLTLIIDADENTLTTPDPSFYWAYEYSTATNYGRHIKYDHDHVGAYFEEGDDLVYDLDLYGMDVVMYDGEVVIPYYIANQLFAGSSYYNVYYNYDSLYGIYSLPSAGTDEYQKIRSSSVSNTPQPADLISYTFNYLAFEFDYFYGLKEINNVETYYDLLFTYKDELLNNSASAFENGLFQFINKVIDEPHTSYGYPGYYNRSTYNGPKLSSLGQLGTRVKDFYTEGIYAVDDAINAKWDEKPEYWFLDQTKTSAVLTLDGFVTSDIEEDAVYNDELVTKILGSSGVLPDIAGGNKYFYYNSSPLDSKAMELLVKGLSANDILIYEASLLAAGYVLDEDTSYYKKTMGEHIYYVAVSYDQTYQLFYLGIVKLDEEPLATSKKLTFLKNTALDLVDADSAVYMEIMLEKILQESPSLENIILDITNNTGGNVGALYRVVGFITSAPFRVSSIDGGVNRNSSSYVYIEGVPVYENLNWALLTSPATFSAGNSLSTIFLENNLGPIIGSKSGGGASSITPVLLPNGTAFTMSSNNISAYRTGDGTEESPYVYHSNEYGITPDYEVPVYTEVGKVIFANIYDEATLIGILQEYYTIG